MPIQATPASARPIHTPHFREASATPFEDEFVDERNAQHDRAQRHRQLRNPQRRGVVAGGDVVEVPRLPGQPHAVVREERGEHRRHGQRPQFQRAPRAAPHMFEDQRHPNVLTAFERMRQREKTCRRHAVTGVRVRTRQVEIE
jgi:hypothetical protein